MKSKVIAASLILSALLSGCATSPPVAAPKLYDYSADPSSAAEGCVLKGLGNRLAIRVSAESWPALVEKVKPTFAWNGRDLMWIETDLNGQPRFVLDEAYIYQPTNQPPRWVLLDTHEGPFDEFYGTVMGNNLRGVATVRANIPMADNDWGAVGEFAVAKSTHPLFGTVYEIGWQKLMANGSCLCEYNRRFYVLRDRANQWHFIGEGIGDSSGKSGTTSSSTDVKSRAIWTKSETTYPPLEIQFICQVVEGEASDAPDFDPRPTWTTYGESILTGPFPALPRETAARSYLLAEKDDTFDKIAGRCAAWMPARADYPDHTSKDLSKEKTLEIWRNGLARLNPQLPKTGFLKKDTRIEILTSQEVRIICLKP